MKNNPFRIIFLFLCMYSIVQKKKRYERICIQLGNILSTSPTFISQLASINAIIYYKIPYVFWAGFYILENNRLLVGPYQGPLACQQLPYAKGACWHSVLNKKSLLLADVSQFPGHIACDPRSKSELVVPVFDNKEEIFGVMDIDSERLNAFDKADEEGISKIMKLIRFQQKEY
jgi:L-methionine (R)-S-oxide reductase